MYVVEMHSDKERMPLAVGNMNVRKKLLKPREVVSEISSFAGNCMHLNSICMISVYCILYRLLFIGKMDRLVAYCSAQAHSSVERAGMLAGIQMRLVEPDENFR